MYYISYNIKGGPIYIYHITSLALALFGQNCQIPVQFSSMHFKLGGYYNRKISHHNNTPHHHAVFDYIFHSKVKQT